MFKFIDVLYACPETLRDDKYTETIGDAFNCFGPDIKAMVEETVANYDVVTIEKVVWPVVKYFAGLKTRGYVDGRVEYAADIAEALARVAPEVHVTDDIRYFTESYLPRVHATLRQAFAGYIFSVIRKLAEQAGEVQDVDAVRQTRYFCYRDSDEEIGKYYPRCPMV